MRYVTGFEKMCIVHASDFAHSKLHEMEKEKHQDLKFTGQIKD